MRDNPKQQTTTNSNGSNSAQQPPTNSQQGGEFRHVVMPPHPISMQRCFENLYTESPSSECDRLMESMRQALTIDDKPGKTNKTHKQHHIQRRAI